MRGVFYRVMSAGAVEKSEKAYAAVQREVLKLRRSGVLPYEWIADGTRWQVKQPSWDTAKDALDDAVASYRRALWRDQDVYVEVWSEKDAIASIVSPITNKWDVPLMIARGVRLRIVPVVHSQHDPQPRRRRRTGGDLPVR